MSIADAVKELEAKVLRLERDRYDEVEAHNKAARERDDARAALAKVNSENEVVTIERNVLKSRLAKADAGGLAASQNALAVAAVLGAVGDETVLDAAKRVVRERDDARAALAKVTAEWAACHAESAGKDGAVKVLQKNLDAMFEQRRTSKTIDPSAWRGPHGAPREDDTHRARWADVDGVSRLLVATPTGWEVYEPTAKTDGESELADGITAACAAADAHVAGLGKGKVFTVERAEREGNPWLLLIDGKHYIHSIPRDIALAIWRHVFGVGSEITTLTRDDFVGEHWARLFANGGTITESEVRAWVAARGGE